MAKEHNPKKPPLKPAPEAVVATVKTSGGRKSLSALFIKLTANSSTGAAPAASGTTGVSAIAAIPLGAWSTLHRPKRPYAKRSISACASAISGISGVGAKPSSAGARTA